jgi:methyltransferase (TIGR00027 family)
MPQMPADELKGVSQTLLIPLHYRVEESRSESSNFKDEVAERFHDAIAYDWNEFDTYPSQGLMTSGIRAVFHNRFAILDKQVRAFLEKAPSGLVVNLGAGLDTRFYRLDNGRVEWIELDLPGVIEFRQKLHEPENARHRLIAASVLDEGWIAEIKRHTRNRVLFVAEGLFPYFTEEEHRKIFTCLAENFPGQEMLFHTLAPSLVQKLAQYRHTLMANLSIKAELRWGLDDSNQVSALNPKVEFVEEYPLIDGGYERFPESIQQKLSPTMARQVMKIVHVRFRE